MKRLIRVILVILVALTLSAVAGADTIALRQSATVSPTAPVRLSDIAILTGADAGSLSEVVVVERPRESAGERGWFEFSVHSLRDSLAEESINWGRITIRGGACTIRLRTERDQDAPAPDAQSTSAKKNTGPTIRDAAVAAIARTLAVGPEDLRLTFLQRDGAFLDRSSWGVRVETQPVTSGSSARQAVAIRLYEGETLIEERTVRADALVHVDVLTLARQIERKAEISAADFSTQRVWISPTGSPPSRVPSDVIGKLAESRLEAGTILRQAHIEHPIAVERGERVTVHCISGGIALKIKARALADGRVGDLIEMQLEGKRSPFTARISGRAVAVVALDAIRSTDPEVE
jgi:flagella basal body P-ring formation protein FlgA